jgi:hypothetical protein
MEVIMMGTKNRSDVLMLASAFAFGLAAIPQVAAAAEEPARRGSITEQNNSVQSDRQINKKSNSATTGQNGSGQNNAAPGEWEKAQGKGKKKGGGSTGGDTGMGSSSSQGSSTSGTSSGSGGY